MKQTRPIKENHLFRRLYAKGKSVGGANLVVYARKNGRQENRLGLTVGTKVGKAVRRNKVRRRIREAYRLHELELSIGWDIIIVARVKAAFSSYAQLERELLRLLDKLGVRRA